ncbi:MAG TPA: hypothetical protein VK454_05410 [Myxococcaceae bacterium]|nr:hypothetical protein [Myxococcaceae bacterium]
MEPALGNDLERLLALEERLSARLGEARAAAARLLESARIEATEVARQGEAAERAGRVRLETEVAGEVEAELARIEARAEERVRVYAGVTAERLRALSLGLLEELLTPGAGEGRG